MKRALFPIIVVVILSVFIYSCSSDDDDSAPPSVIQTPTGESEPDAKQYTLTVSAGEGGSVSSEGGTYDEGTQLTIKANPNDGVGFAGWTNFESNSSTINITLNSNTSLSASFITLPSLSMVSSSTSIFTKSKKDTLTFEANVPGGFDKLEINSDNGDVEIVSQPEIGATSGEIKLTYNPQAIVNVDYTITIAGYDDLSISVFDSYENNSIDDVRVKTQPEPLLNKNYVKSHLDLKFSRIKVDPRLIRFLNQRDNFSLGCYVDNNFGDTSNYNQNGNSYDELRDIAYVDLNLDGYDDIVLHPIFSNNNNSNFASVKFPIEVYMYINGEYIYREVLNQNGSGDSKVSLADSVFNQEFNQDLVHQLVNTYIHNSHQGTKGQKNRSAVRGGGRKPWKQKGTGRARAGTIRSPIWRGGGMTFAHTYSDTKPKKINKKMYRAAMRSIWSKLAEENKLIAVSDLQIDEPVKSSQVKTILSDLGLNTALIVLSSRNDNLNKASKNLTQCKVQTISSIDPSALIQAEKVIVTSATLEKLTEVLS